jgi:c-di-GMP-binding flagellar brake protein YcgR
MYTSGRRQIDDRRKKDLGYDDSHPVFKWERRTVMDRRQAVDRRKKYIEKRKGLRFKAKGGLVAEFHKAQLFSFGRKRATWPAEVLDISPNGIRLQYLGRGMQSPKFKKLSVGLLENNLQVADLPFKVITDYKVANHPQGGQVRRCGLKFESLSNDQKTRLSYFIEHWTLDSGSRATDLPGRF